MSARDSRTQFAILGMLSTAPRSGYEIKKDIDSSIRNIWRENFGQIYPILRRLEQQGLVTGEEKLNSGRPMSRVYTITPAGRDQLRAWILEPTAPMAFRHELLLKVFFSHQISHSDRLELVRSYRDRMRLLLAQYQAEARRHSGEAEPAPGLAYLNLTRRFGIGYCELSVRWAEEALAELERLEAQIPAPPAN